MTNRLHRSDCAVLSLVLKGKWFDMIHSGIKRQEYRDMTDYWATRLAKWNHSPLTHVVEFRHGYRRNSRRLFFLAARLQTRGGPSFFASASFSKSPEWGEPRHPHYLIQLGEPVTLI